MRHSPRPYWTWVASSHHAGDRRDHKVVLVRADSLRPQETPEAYKAAPCRVRGYDGQIWARADDQHLAQLTLVQLSSFWQVRLTAANAA
jgi:hypothetical protein